MEAGRVRVGEGGGRKEEVEDMEDMAGEEEEEEEEENWGREE